MSIPLVTDEKIAETSSKGAAGNKLSEFPRCKLGLSIQLLPVK